MKLASFLLAICVLALSLGVGPAQEAKPLTLKEARDLALKRHPRITAAELQALAAKQVVVQTRSAFLPSLLFNATAVGTSQENTRIAAGALNNPAIYERQADGLIFSQLITDFGRTAHLSKSSELRARAQEKNVEATQYQILVAVDVAFFNALKAQAVLAVSKQTLATRQLLLEQVSALASNKLKSELDVSFARVDREGARLLVAKSENDVQAAWAGLAVLLGSREAPAFALVPEPAAPSGPSPAADELVRIALEQRPDLAQLRYDHEATAQFARAEAALRYPTVSAFGTGGVIPVRDEQVFDREYAAAGINLSFPLFTGGLFTARKREAELRANAVAAGVIDAENEVVREVRVAHLNTQYALEQVGLTEQLFQSSSQAYELAQARYRLGTTSMIELSQSELNLTQADIARTSARFDLQIQRALLNYSVGAKVVTGARP
jgi:outer membrane protein